MSVHKRAEESLIAMGNRIKEKRQENDLSMSELAQKAGISVDFLNEIERGEKDINMETFFEIKKALGVSIGYLFGEE
jgi:transcriptional regulator with XRE-family HTH domain